MTNKRVNGKCIKSAQLVTFAEQNKLTERETEVFVLLANNVVSSADLGKELGVSHHTISNHLKNIFHKTNTGNKAELLAAFINATLLQVVPQQSNQL